MPLASCRRCLRKEDEAQGGLAVRLGRAFSPRLWFNQGTWGYAPGCDVSGPLALRNPVSKRTWGYAPGCDVPGRWP